MARRTLQKLDNDLTSRRAEMERVGRELAQHRHSVRRKPKG